MLTAYAIFQSDLHNLPEALEAFSEALDLCDLQDDPPQYFAVWQNLAAALLYAELPRLAIYASHTAVEYAHKIQCPATRQVDLALALTNIGYACLFTRQYALGLRSATEAQELIGAAGRTEQSSDSELVAYQCLTLTVRARLLQRVGSLDEARRCVEWASGLAVEIAKYSRTASNVELTCALHDVYSGRFEKGISRLTAFASRADSFSAELAADALRDLVEANVVANRQDGVDKYMRRLGDHMRRVRSENVLYHHRRHIERLASGESSDEYTMRGVADQRPQEFFFHARSRDRVRKRVQQLEDLCIAAELHDDPSGRHPHRVGRLAELLCSAGALTGLEGIAIAARLHDVGKVGVPASILQKQGPLIEAEWQIMQSHTTFGADLLESVDIDGRDLAVAVAKHHHEWWSGTGYPDGLAGLAIPLAARVVALAEAFDAMTHDRAYRPRLGVERALELIWERAGRQFDPVLAEVFCGAIRDLCARHGELDRYLEHDVRESLFLFAKRRLTDGFGPPST